MPPSLTEVVLNDLQSRIAVVDRAGELVYTNRAWDEPGSTDVFPSTTADSPYLEVRLTRIEYEGCPHVLIAAGELSDSPSDVELKERAIDESPIGIVISGPTTEDRDNPLVYANDAFEEITGYGREEMLGNDCRFLQGEETSEEAVSRLAGAIEERETTTAVVRNYRKDGTGFWNEVTVAPLSDDGDVTNFVGFQQDVTEREEAKRDLATERDRLALLNQIVRHDIRNDMAVVLGWADVLEEHVDPEGMDAFKQILDAATHTRDLTESVRDITDVLGSEEPELEAVSLAKILRREIERVRSSFDYRLETLTIECEDVPDDLEVWATPLLSSVFSNLLNNAVLHNHTDDVEITVSVDVDTETVTVRIADDGPGISDSRKTEIFGMGTQGLESTGTGLGLYLVDTLVDIYGGDVWVSDTDHEGSIFSVELRRVDRSSGGVSTD
ncbi:PAS domain S-box protein [Natrialbaceae archaeon A-gly3]